MGPVDALLLVGVAAIIVGLIGPRLSPRLAGKRRWFVIAGIALVIIGASFGVDDFVRGYRDAQSADSK
jgi:hypothetical protein